MVSLYDIPVSIGLQFSVRLGCLGIPGVPSAVSQVAHLLTSDLAEVGLNRVQIRQLQKLAGSSGVTQRSEKSGLLGMSFSYSKNLLVSQISIDLSIYPIFTTLPFVFLFIFMLILSLLIVLTIYVFSFVIIF